MKCNMRKLVKELGVTADAFLVILDDLGFGDIEMPISALGAVETAARKRLMPCGHVQVSFDALPAGKGTRIPPAGAPLAPRDPSMAAVPQSRGDVAAECLTAQEAAEALGLYPKLFISGIKRGLVKPTRITKGPKGCPRYYFDDEALQVLRARQSQLRAEGVISSKELQEKTGLAQSFVSVALKKFPRVKDGFLLQTKDSSNAGAHRVYYRHGALELLEVRREEARLALEIEDA